VNFSTPLLKPAPIAIIHGGSIMVSVSSHFFPACLCEIISRLCLRCRQKPLSGEPVDLSRRQHIVLFNPCWGRACLVFTCLDLALFPEWFVSPGGPRRPQESPLARSPNRGSSVAMTCSIGIGIEGRNMTGLDLEESALFDGASSASLLSVSIASQYRWGHLDPELSLSSKIVIDSSSSL